MAYIKEKIGKRLGLLKKTEKFLSLLARTVFYNSIIQPIFDYGAIVWGSNNKQHVQDIVKLQKRCPRIILDRKMGHFLETCIQKTKYLAIILIKD